MLLCLKEKAPAPAIWTTLTAASKSSGLVSESILFPESDLTVSVSKYSAESVPMFSVSLSKSGLDH